MSLQYLALLEIARKFPSGEMLERLANALDIETYELLAVAPSPQSELEQLKKEIVYEIKETISYAVKESLAEEYKKQKR